MKVNPLGTHSMGAEMQKEIYMDEDFYMVKGNLLQQKWRTPIESKGVGKFGKINDLCIFFFIPWKHAKKAGTEPNWSSSQT